jgi:purine-binding chemotaxis protein CheW
MRLDPSARPAAERTEAGATRDGTTWDGTTRGDATGATARVETAPDEAGAEALSVGLFRIGAALLALPALAIREVIPGQASYSPLPIKAEGLRGAVNLRGAIIPVLDLRPALGLPMVENGDHVVLIMRRDRKLIGLVADAVRGIARVERGALFALEVGEAEPGGGIATHAFQIDDEIATLLDARRVAERPNVPMVVETRATDPARHATGTDAILLLTCGNSHFGVAATCVDATVPRVRIERNALAAGFCLGIVAYQGQEVPVIDTVRAFGLGAGAARAESAVVILRFPPKGLLAFVLDEVRDIARIARSSILPMPAVARRETALFAGLFADATGRQHLLVDADALRADPAFALFAGLCKPRRLAASDGGRGGTSDGAPGRAGQSTTPVLTYWAGGERATPLTQISVILPFPAHVAPFEGRGPAVLGLFVHRGRVAPLVCLATLLDQPRDFVDDDARVLVVEEGDVTVGFVARGLRSIDTATWHSPAATPAARDVTLFRALVRVGAGAEGRMISHIDLHGLLDRYREPGADAAGTGATSEAPAWPGAIARRA